MQIYCVPISQLQADCVITSKRLLRRWFGHLTRPTMQCNTKTIFSNSFLNNIILEKKIFQMENATQTNNEHGKRRKKNAHWITWWRTKMRTYVARPIIGGHDLLRRMIAVSMTSPPSMWNNKKIKKKSILIYRSALKSLDWISNMLKYHAYCLFSICNNTARTKRYPIDSN